jgi:hypothetical protein
MFPLLVLIFLLSACLPQKTLSESGNVIREVRAISNVIAVQFHNAAGELIIEQGEQESLVLEMDENLMPYFQTTVKNGVLIIEMKIDFIPVGSFSPVRIYLTVKDLDALEVTGLGSVTMKSLTTPQLTITSKTADKILVDNLQVDQLFLDVNGLGTVELSGNAASQDVNIKGSGIYQAEDLHSQNATISLDGLGKAVVWVDESLDVTLRCTAVLSYYGQNPQVNQQVSGIGSVEFLGTK